MTDRHRLEEALDAYTTALLECGCGAAHGYEDDNGGYPDWTACTRRIRAAHKALLSLFDEVIARNERQTESLTHLDPKAYPHMCRDDHGQVGFSGDNERCPVCLMRDDKDAEIRLLHRPMPRWTEEELADRLAPAVSLALDHRLTIEECKRAATAAARIALSRGVGSDALTTAAQALIATRIDGVPCCGCQKCWEQQDAIARAYDDAAVGKVRE